MLKQTAYKAHYHRMRTFS